MMISKALAALALLIFIAWMVVDPGFEPAAGSVTALLALIGLFVVDNKKNKAQGSGQHQSVANASVGIQAGGDVNVGNFSHKSDVK